MMNFRPALGLSIAFGVLLYSQAARAQAATPPSGYFDIPSGFDFPADKQVLEQYRSQANVPAQRTHVWNVFAGMTQPTPDGKLARFETWFSEDDTFDPGASALSPRTTITMPRFQLPNQFRSSGPGFGPTAAPEAPGSAVLSFVLYNFAGYNHVRTNKLYERATLNALMRSGAPDAKIPRDRTVPSFPAGAVVLKTVWWPVAKDKISAMPIWDPELNPAQATGNPISTWARYIGVDPTRPTVPAGETADIVYDGQTKRASHIVDLKRFHSMVLDQNAVNGINSDGVLASVAQKSFGRPLAVGDYAVLVATHLTTKEIDDWVWATFWWHDKPDDGPFAANRLATVSGPWRNYLMSASYDLNLPKSNDNSPHVAFNPWLEARFPDGGHGSGVVSNCMNCHNRASWPEINFLPVNRGEPDLTGDAAYAARRLRTDFLWSIPDLVSQQ
ncbi:MAG: hypothetical protein JOZ16_00955 [Methylobacteriaceae bacterium]|nr:hypothetical protein [Methylobacteriaceae bacterium]